MRYEYGPNDFYLSVMNPTPRIALFVGWFVRDKICRIVLSALAHSTNDEYQESAVLFGPLDF